MFSRVVPAVAAALLTAAGALPACDTGLDDEATVLVGAIDRAAIEALDPSWTAAQVEAELDAEAAMELAMVEPGATVEIFLGTWCSDSRRELGRFWRALDVNYGLVAFDVSYVGVDRAKAEPAGQLEGLGIDLVPTFIVRRDGREVGRVVETAPHGIEHDLVALLTGEAAGRLGAESDDS